MSEIDFGFLSTLGWDAHFSAQLGSPDDGLPGRVITAGRKQVQVQTGPETVVWAEVSGRFAHEAASRKDFPGVGDWVLCEIASEGRAIIRKVLDRKTVLLRKAAGDRLEEQVLAANVDTVFIVTSLNKDFNARRLERYLTLVWMSGAAPVVLLTKADLCPDPAPYLEEVRKLGPDVLTHSISSVTGQGLAELETYLTRGTTSVLLGSSGVGKSTLVNRLFGAEITKTNEIREDDARGRHTTTTRNLWQSTAGAMIIDTPGMRELQLWDDGQGFEAVFADVEQLALGCKFTNCKHENEPGCRIREAIKTGELAPERFDSYKKIQGELAAQRRKVDKEFASNERQKWKKRNIEMHDHISRKKRGENF